MGTVRFPNKDHRNFLKYYIFLARILLNPKDKNRKLDNIEVYFTIVSFIKPKLRDYVRKSKVVFKLFSHLGVQLLNIKTSIGTIMLIIYIVLINYKNIKNIIKKSDTALVLSLSKAQINSFILIIGDKRFSKEFSIPLIRDADVIILQASNNFYKKINKKIVIGSNSIKLFLALFLFLILKIKFMQILKNTFAECVNMLAAECNLSVFVTNSFSGDDPYNFNRIQNKRFNTHCAHYSENSLPREIGEPMANPYGHPGVQWLVRESSDYQWVWSEEYAAFIRKINPKTRVNVVGYVNFDHLPKLPIFRITVFNVTPQTSAVIKDVLPLDQVSEAKKFITDILKVREAMNKKNNFFKVSVSIKPKREYHRTHSAEYVKFLENLQKEHVLTLEHHSTNSFELVSNSDLVIGMPFTTAAQIGKNMSIPSVYYNCLDKKIYYPIKTSVKLLQNYLELFVYVDQLVNEKSLRTNR